MMRKITFSSFFKFFFFFYPFLLYLIFLELDGLQQALRRCSLITARTPNRHRHSALGGFGASTCQISSQMVRGTHVIMLSLLAALVFNLKKVRIVNAAPPAGKYISIPFSSCFQKQQKKGTLRKRTRLHYRLNGLNSISI